MVALLARFAAVGLALAAATAQAPSSTKISPVVLEAGAAAANASTHVAAVENSIYVIARSAATSQPAIVAFRGVSSRVPSGQLASAFLGLAQSPSVFNVKVQDAEGTVMGASAGSFFQISAGGASTPLLSPASSADEIASALSALPTQPDPGSLQAVRLPDELGATTFQVSYRYSSGGFIDYTASKGSPSTAEAVTLTRLADAAAPPAPVAAPRSAWPNVSVVQALPPAVAALGHTPDPFADPRATAGPALAASHQWVVVGHPSAFRNQSGLVVVRHRAEDGSLGPPRVVHPRVPPEDAAPFQGVINLTATVALPNPWTADVGGPLPGFDTAGGTPSASQMLAAPGDEGPRFGASVAVDGPWMVVGAPAHTLMSAEGPVRPGSFHIFALSRHPATSEPRAVMAVRGAMPASLAYTGARSGPHRAAPAVTGGVFQDAECGSAVAIGGGFVAIGCPALSMPATASSAAVASSGGILILRRSAPNGTAAHAAAWPDIVSEEHTSPLDLRGDAAVTGRPSGEPPRAEDVVRSAAWPLVQLLVPSGASPGLRLGAGSGSASLLAVTSRHVAAAQPGGTRVFVWRRRSGRAPAFDPVSMQVLSTSSAVSGIALVGPRLVVSLDPAAAAGPAAAQLFEADALGVFSPMGAGVAGMAADGPVFGAVGSLAVPPGVPGCNTSAGARPGAAVAAAVPFAGGSRDNGQPALRVVVTCEPPPGADASGGPVVVSLFDAAPRCPSLLSRPAAPSLAMFPSVASSRSIFTRSPGQMGESGPGECGDTPPRPLGAEAFPAPFPAANRSAPASALGRGPAAACVMPCDYGHALASGSQLATCEPHAAWSLLPDELPTCEGLVAAAPPQEAVARGRRVPASLPPGSAASASVPGLPGMFAGGDDVDSSPLVTLTLGRTPTIGGLLTAAALSPAVTSPLSLLANATPSGPPSSPAATMRSVLGAFRAVDGTYAVARAVLPTMPVLAAQARAAAPDTNQSLPSVPEASGGAAPPGDRTFFGHRAALARTRARAALAASALGRLPDAQGRPAGSAAASLGPSQLLGATLQAVSASLLVRRSDVDRVPAERFRPVAGSRHNVTRCAAGMGCGATRADAGGSPHPDREELGPATDPLSPWERPGLTLDPLSQPRFRHATSRMLPGRRAAAVRTSAAGGPAWGEPESPAVVPTSGSLGASAASSLALPGAAGTPLVRFSPANASPSGLADGPATAGHLSLSHADLLGSEALLAPMTWHGGHVDVDVAMQARGGPALGGVPLSTTLPLRVCCATGRGREPSDERRRRRGPLVTRVRVTVSDFTTSILTQAMPGHASTSFLQAVMARASLRLGNLSAAASLMGQAAATQAVPAGATLDLGPPGEVPAMTQRLGAGTASLDVPGASVELAMHPVSSWSLAPPLAPGATAATGPDPVTGRYEPSAQGAVFDLRVSGFGAPDPSDATGPCSSLERQPQGPAAPAAWLEEAASERTANVRATLGNSRQSYSATASLEAADRLARLILRAAAQPISWFERRRCVASDRRSA